MKNLEPRLSPPEAHQIAAANHLDDGVGVFTAFQRLQNPAECATAKFAVLAFPSVHGIGMALKDGPVAAALFALASERVLLFVNNRRTPKMRHKSLQKPLAFASCPAGDMSCSFLPMSPCQVTDDELDSAPELNTMWDCSKPHTPCLVREVERNTSRHRVVVLGRSSGAGASNCWDGQCSSRNPA